MNKPIPASRMGGLFSTKKESEVTSHESRVMKHETLPTEPEEAHERVATHELRQSPVRQEEAHESRVITHESGIMNHESLSTKQESGKIDQHTLDLAVTQGCKDPRISAYSPLVMSVLSYLRKTTPELSMSEVASNLLEDAIRENYPELSAQVEKALAKR